MLRPIPRIPVSGDLCNKGHPKSCFLSYPCYFKAIAIRYIHILKLPYQENAATLFFMTEKYVNGI